MATVVKRGARIVAWTAAALVVAAAVYIHTPAFRHTVERRVTVLLSETTGRDVRFRLKRLRPLALSAQIEELRIGGRSSASGPFLELGETRVDGRMLPLLRGRLHLANLSVDRAHFDLDELPVPTSEGEEPEDADGAPVAMLTELARIDRAVIHDGRFLYTEPQSGVRFDAGGIRIDLERFTGPERYRGGLEIATGTIGIPDLGEIPLTAATRVELDASTLGLSGLEMQGPGVDLDASMTFTDFVPFRATTALELQLRPERLPAALRDAIAVRGRIATTGTASFDASDYVLDLDVSSPEVVWNEWVAGDVTVDLAGTPRAWDAEFALALQGIALEGEAHGMPRRGSFL